MRAYVRMYVMHALVVSVNESGRLPSMRSIHVDQSKAG
jgi:hypothetical protein